MLNDAPPLRLVERSSSPTALPAGMTRFETSGVVADVDALQVESDWRWKYEKNRFAAELKILTVSEVKGEVPEDQAP